MKNFLKFIFWLFLSGSCKQGKNRPEASKLPNLTSYPNSDHQMKLSPRYGARYHYNLQAETLTRLEVNDKEIETINTSEIGLLYEITQKDSANNTDLKITYDQLRITITNKDGEKEILDADNASGPFNSVDKILASIKGTAIHIILTPKGKILKVSGSDEIASKAMASLNSLDANTRSQVQDLLSSLTGDKFINNTLAEHFNVFPDTALYEGLTWTKKITIPSIVNFIANTQFKLESMDEDIVEIESSGTIENGKDATAMVMGSSVINDIQGKQTGSASFFISTGMLKKATSKTVLEGSLIVRGREVPVYIKITRKMSGEEL